MPEHAPVPLFRTLTTERLVLRSVERTDGDALRQIRSDAVVRQYVRRPVQTASDIAGFMDRVKREMAEGRLVFWGIVLQGSNTLIGDISLRNFSDDRKCAEIGYELLPAFHHKGIMYEAIKAVARYGMEHLGPHTIEAYTHTDNMASIRLLEKAGFEHLPQRTDPDVPDNRIYAFHKPAASQTC